MRTLIAVLLAGAMLASACSSSTGKSDAPGSATSTSGATSTSTQPEPKPLPVGKADLALVAGKTYTSPDGFSPALRITIPGDGWNSTHRGSDAFDVGQPVPGADAALVVVAFLTPEETSTTQALAAIMQRAKHAGAKVAGTGTAALQIRGGEGPLVTSRDGSIALDAVPDGYATIQADDRGGPLLTVTWVPDSTNRKLADQRSARLTAAVSHA